MTEVLREAAAAILIAVAIGAAGLLAQEWLIWRHDHR